MNISNIQGKKVNCPDIEKWDGGYVSRKLLEKALDLFISLEPVNQSSPTADEEYKANHEVNKNLIEISKKILVNYGKQIRPETLENMQDVYYSITNSKKYVKNPVNCSVVRSALNRAWDGISEWRK